VPPEGVLLERRLDCASSPGSWDDGESLAKVARHEESLTGKREVLLWLSLVEEPEEAVDDREGSTGHRGSLVDDDELRVAEMLRVRGPGSDLWDPLAAPRPPGADQLDSRLDARVESPEHGGTRLQSKLNANRIQ
jgi:hypothetical protein